MDIGGCGVPSNKMKAKPGQSVELGKATGEVSLRESKRTSGKQEMRTNSAVQPAAEIGLEHLLDYANVLAHAVETFGSRANASAWLNRSNRMFANQTPLQILTEDPAAVEEELVRIDHGMFV